MFCSVLVTSHVTLSPYKVSLWSFNSFEYQSYFESTAEAQAVFDEAKRKVELNASTVSNEVPPTNNFNLNNAIKLPELKLIKFDGSYSNYMNFRNLFILMIDCNATLPKSQK